MYRLINYLNSLTFLLLIIIAVNFDSFKVVSSKIDAILPSSENKKLLKEFNSFSNTKKIFLTVKGIDTLSLNRIKDLEKIISSISGISIDNPISRLLNKQGNNYLLYKYSLDYDKFQDINITTELENLKKNLINSQFSYNVDKIDPLNIFNKGKVPSLNIKNNHLILNDYGYFSIFNIDNSIDSLDKFEKLYDLLSIYQDDTTILFSPLFYFVENSRLIKHDVNKIIFLATIILFVLYIVILRNIKLLFNTIVTIGSSFLMALIVCSFIFEELSIFVLVFGASISTVSIDYMFHNYVHNRYDYLKKYNFNKDVLFGMITTVGAFSLLSFISFDLIRQICLFSIVSLLFSYLYFSFIYPLIGFDYIKTKWSIDYKFNFSIKPNYIFLISLLTMVFTYSNIRFDSNLENLNIKNIKLLKMEEFFYTKLGKEKTLTVLISGSTLDDLIDNAYELSNKFKDSYIPLNTILGRSEFNEKNNFLSQLNFEQFKKELNLKSLELGFKKDFFLNSYQVLEHRPIYSLDVLKKDGFDVKKYNNQYLSYALIPYKYINELHTFSYIKIIGVKSLFELELKKIYTELVSYGSLALLFILMMLIIFTKHKFIETLNYILFPISIILIASNFIELNILHIFMGFIILAISIDYGIYMSSFNGNINTKKGIVYSLLSTFAGFGVLIFSNINALFSIGIIATLGILSIIVLLVVSKGFK